MEQLYYTQLYILGSDFRERMLHFLIEASLSFLAEIRTPDGLQERERQRRARCSDRGVMAPGEEKSADK